MNNILILFYGGIIIRYTWMPKKQLMGKIRLQYIKTKFYLEIIRQVIDDS